MSGKVRLNGATSGYAELSAPAAAGTTEITTPVQSGTMVVSSNGSIDNVVTITQAAYDALGTPDATTLYVIVG